MTNESEAPAHGVERALGSAAVVASRQTVNVATTALGLLLLVCGLVGFGYWLRGTVRA